VPAPGLPAMPSLNSLNTAKAEVTSALGKIVRPLHGSTRVGLTLYVTAGTAHAREGSEAATP
jgi:hypothetical protein